MLATYPHVPPDLVFWTPVVLAFAAGWLARSLVRR